MTTATVPLTLDRIRTLAPSAFALEPYYAMSERYGHIPTSDVIQGMMRVGFQPFSALQCRSRLPDKSAFTKHMIRFRTSEEFHAVSDVLPEIVLINSHDGSSAYRLLAGMFRLVCSNGLIVADSL